MAQRVEQLLGLQAYQACSTLHDLLHLRWMEPDIKSYSKIVYLNYYELGVTLQCVPSGNLDLQMIDSSQLANADIIVDCIDIYNADEDNFGENEGSITSQAKANFAQSKLLPLVFPALQGSQFEVSSDTQAVHFVQSLGEPSRKGGGQGPSSGSINIWCEWTQMGLMVEFEGEKARGPLAWDSGKNSVWKYMSIFSAAKE